MSENSQMSTSSTNINNNTPTSDTVSSSVPFTLKRWNLVYVVKQQVIFKNVLLFGVHVIIHFIIVV